jgi:hypothetical protein
MLEKFTPQNIIYFTVALFILSVIYVVVRSKKKESFQDNLSENITIKYELLDNILTNLPNYRKDEKAYINAVEGLLNLAYTCKRLGSVTLYEDCDFKGKNVQLDFGDYTMDDLKKRGINNDNVSSVKVTGRLAAILYEHDNFEGRSIVVPGSQSCLTDAGLNFNDQLSSLKIVSWPPHTIPNINDLKRDQSMEIIHNAIVSLMFNSPEPLDPVVSLMTLYLFVGPFEREMEQMKYQNGRVQLSSGMFKKFQEIHYITSPDISIQEYANLIMKIIAREFINNKVCNFQRSEEPKQKVKPEAEPQPQPQPQPQFARFIELPTKELVFHGKFVGDGNTKNIVPVSRALFDRNGKGAMFFAQDGKFVKIITIENSGKKEVAYFEGSLNDIQIINNNIRFNKKEPIPGSDNTGYNLGVMNRDGSYDLKEESVFNLIKNFLQKRGL